MVGVLQGSWCKVFIEKQRKYGFHGPEQGLENFSIKGKRVNIFSFVKAHTGFSLGTFFVWGFLIFKNPVKMQKPFLKFTVHIRTGCEADCPQALVCWCLTQENRYKAYHPQCLKSSRIMF